MTLPRHFERRADLRVLLGLDHEPTLIAMRGQALDDGGEIERAVARHGEGSLDDRVEEALSGPVELRRSRRGGRPLVCTWLMRL